MYSVYCIDEGAMTTLTNYICKCAPRNNKQLIKSFFHSSAAHRHTYILCIVLLPSDVMWGKRGRRSFAEDIHAHNK